VGFGHQDGYEKSTPFRLKFDPNEIAREHFDRDSNNDVENNVENVRDHFAGQDRVEVWTKNEQKILRNK